MLSLDIPTLFSDTLPEWLGQICMKVALVIVVYILSVLAKLLISLCLSFLDFSVEGIQYTIFLGFIMCLIYCAGCFLIKWSEHNFIGTVLSTLWIMSQGWAEELKAEVLLIGLLYLIYIVLEIFVLCNDWYEVLNIVRISFAMAVCFEVLFGIQMTIVLYVIGFLLIIFQIRDILNEIEM